jgi:ribosomal protein S18 acetylase RimI-like enzyme
MMSLNETTLKIATQQDAPALVSLVNQAYRPAPGKRGWTDEADWVAGERINLEQMHALLADNATVLTLWDKDRLLACVHIQEADISALPKRGTCEIGSSIPISERLAYIGMLATLPEYQGYGLGKRMLALAEQYAVTHFGATFFKMTVLATRRELLAFYERHGYTRTGQRDDYPLSAGVGQPLHEGLQLEVLVKDAPLPIFKDMP